MPTLPPSINELLQPVIRELLDTPNKDARRVPVTDSLVCGLVEHGVVRGDLTVPNGKEGGSAQSRTKAIRNARIWIHARLKGKAGVEYRVFMQFVDFAMEKTAERPMLAQPLRRLLESPVVGAPFASDETDGKWFAKVLQKAECLCEKAVSGRDRVGQLDTNVEATGARQAMTTGSAGVPPHPEASVDAPASVNWPPTAKASQSRSRACRLIACTVLALVCLLVPQSDKSRCTKVAAVASDRLNPIDKFLRIASGEPQSGRSGCVDLTPSETADGHAWTLMWTTEAATGSRKVWLGKDGQRPVEVPEVVARTFPPSLGVFRPALTEGSLRAIVCAEMDSSNAGAEIMTFVRHPDGPSQLDLYRTNSEFPRTPYKTLYSMGEIHDAAWLRVGDHDRLVVCAAGNDASGWIPEDTLSGLSSGTNGTTASWGRQYFMEGDVSRFPTMIAVIDVAQMRETSVLFPGDPDSGKECTPSEYLFVQPPLAADRTAPARVMMCGVRPTDTPGAMCDVVFQLTKASGQKPVFARCSLMPGGQLGPAKDVSGSTRDAISLIPARLVPIDSKRWLDIGSRVRALEKSHTELELLTGSWSDEGDRDACGVWTSRGRNAPWLMWRAITHLEQGDPAEGLRLVELAEQALPVHCDIKRRARLTAVRKLTELELGTEKDERAMDAALEVLRGDPFAEKLSLLRHQAAIKQGAQVLNYGMGGRR